MSHAIVVVMAGSRDQAELMLDPFDEHVAVDAYNRPCHCVGLIAELETREHFDAIYGKTTAEMWNTCQKENPNATPDELKAIWQGIFLPRRKQEESQFFLSHALCKAADPKCPDCNGTGTQTVTYNQIGRFDDYIYGAGWADWQLALNINDIGQPSGTKNCIFQIPDAILTPFTGWRERPKTWGYETVLTEDDAEKTWRRDYFVIYDAMIQIHLFPYIFNYHH